MKLKTKFLVLIANSLIYSMQTGISIGNQSLSNESSNQECIQVQYTNQSNISMVFELKIRTGFFDSLPNAGSLPKIILQKLKSVLNDYPAFDPRKEIYYSVFEKGKPPRKFLFLDHGCQVNVLIKDNLIYSITIPQSRLSQMVKDRLLADYTLRKDIIFQLDRLGLGIRLDLFRNYLYVHDEHNLELLAVATTNLRVISENMSIYKSGPFECTIDGSPIVHNIIEMPGRFGKVDIEMCCLTFRGGFLHLGSSIAGFIQGKTVFFTHVISRISTDQSSADYIQQICNNYPTSMENIQRFGNQVFGQLISNLFNESFMENFLTTNGLLDDANKQSIRELLDKGISFPLEVTDLQYIKVEYFLVSLLRANLRALNIKTTYYQPTILTTEQELGWRNEFKKLYKLIHNGHTQIPCP